MERCDGCGYSYDSLGPAALPAALGELGPRCAAALDGRSDTEVRRRPEPDTWSALEYTCHIRDVLVAQRERLFQALVEDVPAFVSIYRDDRVRLGRYNEMAPASAIREVIAAADMVAWGFGGLDPVQWERRCVYAYPTRAERSLVWLAQHTLHEGVHHLQDIDRSLGGTVPPHGGRRDR